MNMQNLTVMSPPAPKGLAEMRLPLVMMRDILLKTMFRKNIDMVTELASAHLGNAGACGHGARAKAPRSHRDTQRQLW